MIWVLLPSLDTRAQHKAAPHAGSSELPSAGWTLQCLAGNLRLRALL